MSYDQVANRVEIAMWVALLFCAVEVAYGIARWRFEGQESVSSGLFASLAPVVFLLRDTELHALWLMLVAPYGPIAMWRWRLWRARREDLTRSSHNI